MPDAAGVELPDADVSPMIPCSQRLRNNPVIRRVDRSQSRRFSSFPNENPSGIARGSREKHRKLLSRRVPPQEGLEDARVEVGRRLVEGVADAVWRQLLGDVVPQKHAQSFHIRTDRPRAHA